MAAFTLSALKPAETFEGLGKADANDRSARATALRNIDTQLGLIDAKKEGKRTFWDTVIDGKRSYTGDGNSVGFSVKVGSVKLMLGGTQEPGVAKSEFVATLNGIKAAIQAGDLDEQFKKLDGDRSTRTEKMKTTRAAKKAQEGAAKPAEGQGAPAAKADTPKK
jgi:hypothetical protein